MKNVMLLLIGIATLISCSKNNDFIKSNQNNSVKKLIVLAVDVSQSFKKPNIEPEYIKELCKTLESNSGKATVIIYPLGNPSSSPLILSCELQGVPNNQSKALTLSQKKAEVLRKKKVKKENEQLINEFVKNYEEQIYSIKRTAHTDIRAFNRYLYTLVQEERFDGYHKTLYLYSDGINSIKGVDEFYPLDKNIDGLNIYTTGLAETATPFTQEYKELTSYQSFFDLYQI